MIANCHGSTINLVRHVDGNRRTFRDRVSLGDPYDERVASRAFIIKLASRRHGDLSSATNGKGVVRIAAGNAKACWAACGL